MSDDAMGRATLLAALNMIGDPEATDHDLARIIVDNEELLRKLVSRDVNRAAALREAEACSEARGYNRGVGDAAQYHKDKAEAMAQTFIKCAPGLDVRPPEYYGHIEDAAAISALAEQPQPQKGSGQHSGLSLDNAQPRDSDAERLGKLQEWKNKGGQTFDILWPDDLWLALTEIDSRDTALRDAQAIIIQHALTIAKQNAELATLRARLTSSSDVMETAHATVTKWLEDSKSTILAKNGRILKSYIADALTAEREACAGIADEAANEWVSAGVCAAQIDIADRIRARSRKEQNT